MSNSSSNDNSNDPTNNPTVQPKDILKTIQHLLGSPLKITMTDGRTATGIFTCLDRLGNIILSDVSERRMVGFVASAPSAPSSSLLKSSSSSSTTQQNSQQHSATTTAMIDGEKEGNSITIIYKWDTERCLSQAVVPGDKMSKVEIVKREWESKVVDESLRAKVASCVVDCVLDSRVVP